MIKMLVVLDEEKIIRDDVYELNEVKEFIVMVFEKCGITKRDSEGWFLSQDDKYDYGRFMMVIDHFIHDEGIYDNLKEWIWVVNDRTNDVLSEFNRKRLNKINKE